jgi:hypothetical protein
MAGRNTAIWKFPITGTDEFTLDMPKGAKVLTVQMQHDVVTIWAEVDIKAEIVTYDFAVFPTGVPFNPEYTEYIGTFQLMGGVLVFHLYRTNL